MDQMIVALDRALKVLTHTPSCDDRVLVMPPGDENKSIALMRVNYAGEVCAQGLYLGAWSVTPSEQLKDFCAHAMEEEWVHLRWCGDRVYSLGGQVSWSNPVWFAGSFALGAVSALAGASYALGFVAETEHQVLAHLNKHLNLLPEQDAASRDIIEKMIDDEEQHRQEAMGLGGWELPFWAKKAMSLMGKAMTEMTYRG